MKQKLFKNPSEAPMNVDFAKTLWKFYMLILKVLNQSNLGTTI
jgi:hypothetical protein